MAKQNLVSIVNEQDEHRQVRRDLIFVIVLNAIFFAALIGLYFYNRSTSGVDTFFTNLFKF